MRNNKSVIGMAVASALLAMSGGVQASGFALIEQSASGMGNAFAGGAAGAEDASTVFFNPAGMSRIDGNQVAVAAHAIKPSSKFKDGGSTGAALQTAGGNGGDAGDWALVPNAYATTRINEALHFGIGVNSRMAARPVRPCKPRVATAAMPAIGRSCRMPMPPPGSMRCCISASA